MTVLGQHRSLVRAAGIISFIMREALAGRGCQTGKPRYPARGRAGPSHERKVTHPTAGQDLLNASCSGK
jgi:hypothetical protein